MTDITELEHRMRTAAEKASNGDWVKESGDGWEACCSANDQANGGFIIAHFEGPDAAENRAFVQVANPANIIALVEALEKAQTKAVEQGRTACELFDEVTVLRQRIAELEKSESQLIDERDIAEESLGDMYQAATGERPEWSSAFGFADAVDAVEQRLGELESRTVTVKLPEVRITVAEAKRRKMTYQELDAYNAGALAAVEKIQAEQTAKGIKWEAE